MTQRNLTTQERLRYARRALKQAATLVKEAASLGAMSDSTRERLRFLRSRLLTHIETLELIEAEVNEHQSAIRARRSKRKS